MENKSVFTQDNIYTAVLRFAVPGVVTILMAELYNMVDTFFVGRYTGSAAIGALGIAFPVQRLIIALSLMIGVGNSTALSRSLGEKDHGKFRRSIESSAALGLLILGLLPIFFYAFPAPILSFLGARGEIFEMAKAYLNIVVLGSLFLGFTNIFGYEMTAMGYPKITLIATSIGTGINIVVDYLLVAKAGMGVEGAAAATLLSQAVAFVFTVHRMRSHRREYDFSLRPRFHAGICGSILAIGFATFVVEISDAVLIATLNNILLPIGGNEAVIIVGAITRVSMFLYITIIGISAGMQPLAAYSYGAKDYPRLRKIVLVTCRLVVFSCLLLWGTILLFTEGIIGSFMKEEALLRHTTDVFRFTICLFPLISLYYVCIYFCQSVGKARAGFFLSIYRQLLLFIPLLIVLTRVFGMDGAWWTYPLTDLAAALTGIFFLRRSLGELETEGERRMQEPEKENCEK